MPAALPEPLAPIAHWPARHVVAAAIAPDRSVIRAGPTGRRFALASLTKPLLAWAVLVAVEEVTVDLDEPVDGAPAGSTLRHLLAHASGLPFDGTDPIAGVGTERIYSNTGFDLVGEHLHRRSGIPVAEYLREAVTGPLGMADTELVGSAAHGVHSTVDDLVRFITEVLEPRLVAPATADLALVTQYPALGGIVPGVGRFEPCPWGLGFEIAGDKAPHWTGRRRSRRTVGHFGGAGTMMWADPDVAVGLIALTDLPFDRWSGTAVRSWAELSDHVLATIVPHHPVDRSHDGARP